jgi:hypothetical protein
MGPGLSVQYRGWDQSAGVAWPTRLVIEDRDGAFRLACKVSRVRFPTRPESLRIAVTLPPGAERLTYAELRHALERLGTL